MKAEASLSSHNTWISPSHVLLLWELNLNLPPRSWCLSLHANTSLHRPYLFQHWQLADARLPLWHVTIPKNARPRYHHPCSSAGTGASLSWFRSAEPMLKVMLLNEKGFPSAMFEERNKVWALAVLWPGSGPHQELEVQIFNMVFTQRSCSYILCCFAPPVCVSSHRFPSWILKPFMIEARKIWHNKLPIFNFSQDPIPYAQPADISSLFFSSLNYLE